MSYEVVVPTAGRPALGALLAALAAGDGPLPERVLLVDDRPERAAPLAVPRRLGALTVEVLEGDARGPAAARNRGWRAARAEWVAFLDDDVIPPAGWRAGLAADLDGLPAGVAGSQGRIRVPLPRDRAPTDWERNVAGLEHARWATADMAYRRAALATVGGFDERFPRAYREDADLALRLTAAGWGLVRGRRSVLHPVGTAPASVSLAKQAGNADDVLMGRVHGRDWRERAGVPRGRRPRHLATAAAGATAVLLAAPARTRPAAAVAAAAWLAGTAELAWARIAPGPRTRGEAATMAWTSALMPFVATAWWLRGIARRPGPGPVPEPAVAPPGANGRLTPPGANGRLTPPGANGRLAAPGANGRLAPPGAVLFDRDGTLVVDVPYNGDPARVVPMPGAASALGRLRDAGIPTGVVSNQSGVARGLLSPRDVEAVNARLDALVGPLGPVEWCPHAPGDGCGCRKPAPGLVLRAAARLGVDPRRCAVVGDIGADVEAARAAGARAILVPTARTRPEEVEAADEVAPDLERAVDLLLGVRS